MSPFWSEYPLEASRESVSMVESRVIARRQRVKVLTAAIREKSHEQATSAGMMITAFGVGVALEQVKRRHVWWFVSLLGATNTLARLASAAAALVRPTGSSAGS